MNSGFENTSVLTSWKDIARYMGKGVRTVQRWEQDFGLPVRRPFGSDKKAVLARPRDLDAWVALRCSRRSQLRLPDGGAGQAATLASLAAQLHASRELRHSNRELLDEVHSVIGELRMQITSIQTQKT